MSKEVTLRELARIYARGAIDRSSYHKSRAELINGIIEGRIKINNTEQTSPSKKDRAISEAREREKRDNSVTEIRPDMSAAGIERDRSDSNKRLLLIFIGIGVAILAILIILVVLLIQEP